MDFDNRYKETTLHIALKSISNDEIIDALIIDLVVSRKSSCDS